MKLDDYRDADCKLFRLPPIDTSRIENLLAQQLVQAWQNGATANEALQTALNNDELVGSLVGELEEHINFQQKVGTANVEAEVQANIDAYDVDKEQKVAAITNLIAGEKQTKREALEGVSEVVREKREVYSAQQARLDEMRERVEARLKAVGGDKKLEMLLQIHTAVQSTTGTTGAEKLMETGKDEGTQTVVSTRGNYSGTKSEGYSTTTTPVTLPRTERKVLAGEKKYVTTKSDSTIEGKNYDPNSLVKDTTTKSGEGLEQKVTTEDGAIVPAVEKQHGRMYRAANAVWKVLNYKIW